MTKKIIVRKRSASAKLTKKGVVIEADMPDILPKKLKITIGEDGSIRGNIPLDKLIQGVVKKIGGGKR